MASVSSEPSPHRTSTLPRIRRSNPAPWRDFRSLYCEERSDSLLLPAPRAMSPGCRDPFALCRSFSCALGGRDSTDYDGSAVLAQAWVICPPTLYQGASARSGVAHTALSLPWSWSTCFAVSIPSVLIWRIVDPPANGVMSPATLLMTDTRAGIQLDGSIPSIVLQCT